MAKTLLSPSPGATKMGEALQSAYIMGRAAFANGLTNIRQDSAFWDMIKGWDEDSQHDMHDSWGDGFLTAKHDGESTRHAYQDYQ